MKGFRSSSKRTLAMITRCMAHQEQVPIWEQLPAIEHFPHAEVFQPKEGSMYPAPNLMLWTGHHHIPILCFREETEPVSLPPEFQ